MIYFNIIFATACECSSLSSMKSSNLVLMPDSTVKYCKHTGNIFLFFYIGSVGCNCKFCWHQTVITSKIINYLLNRFWAQNISNDGFSLSSTAWRFLRDCRVWIDYSTQLRFTVRSIVWDVVFHRVKYSANSAAVAYTYKHNKPVSPSAVRDYDQ